MILTPAEFKRRASALQDAMEADALLLTSPADIFYLTGFLTRFWESPARPWFVVLPSSGAPIAVIPSIGAPLMARTWLSDIRTWDAPDLADDGVSLLAGTLAELVPDQGVIALQMGHESQLRMPLADFRQVQAALAPRSFTDATPAIRHVREVKSEAEIALIRQTCAVADRAFARVPEIAGAGAPLDQVFRDFQRLLLEEGADWVSYLAGGAGPGGYEDVISPASDTPLCTGDVLMLDTGAVRQGYFCDFDRNWSVGPASDAVQRGHDLLWRATEAGLAAATPGATVADLHRAMADVLGEAALGGRFGHGLGVTLTEWPSLIPSDRTALREGMVLTLEPGLDLGHGHILVHEENIVIRARGAELLSTRAPAEIPQI